MPTAKPGPALSPPRRRQRRDVLLARRSRQVKTLGFGVYCFRVAPSTVGPSHVGVVCKLVPPKWISFSRLGAPVCKGRKVPQIR